MPSSDADDQSNQKSLIDLRFWQRQFDSEMRRKLTVADKAHRRICESLGTAVASAVEAGNALVELQAVAPTGQWTSIVQAGFCKPNGISLKTAQRYMAIARAAQSVCAHLRDTNPSWADQSDQQILSKISLNQALSIVQKLKHAAVESQQEVPDAARHSQGKSGVDRWTITPEYAAILRQFNEPVQTDLTNTPELNPLGAVRTIAIEAIDSELKLSPGLHWSMPGPDRKAIERVTQFAVATHRESADIEFLLLLPLSSFAAASWLAHYPIALKTTPLQLVHAATGKVRLVSPSHVLLFIGPNSRFAQFAKAFTASHHLLIPFPN
jgi:hypothetical protein